MSRRVEPPPRRRSPRVVWWADLGRWARVSVAGLIAAALLAVGLAWFIPRWVGQRFLQTQARADQTVLTALTETEALVVSDDENFDELDSFVRSAILQGDFVRVKLWSPDGTILYSDEPQLVGRRFVPDEDFGNMFEPTSHRSDLSAEENVFERDEFDSGLLETYVPVRSADGELLAVWEVYHLLEEHDAAVAATRRTVWITVGSGLGLLAVFLMSVFGGLVAAAERRRREAEGRSADLTTLLNIARAAAQTLDQRTVITTTLDELDALGVFEWITLTRQQEASGRTPIGGRGREPEDQDVSRDPAAVDRRIETTTKIHNDTLVMVGAVMPDADRVAAAAVLQAAVDELGVAVERADLYDDLESSHARLKELTKRLVSAHEHERRRIVGEIHDGLGQDLHRVLFGLRGCLGADAPEVDEELRKLEELVSNSSGRLRRLMQDLHPSLVDDIGLAASLRSLVERMRNEYGLQTDFVRNDFPEPPEATRLALFRIAQEALMNVVKHSGTDEARLVVTGDDGHIELEVSDDGQSLAASGSDGLGLWLMRERAEALGGSFAIQGSNGTVTINARIPFEAVP